MAEAQGQLASAIPAHVVVANHAMGLYELAAIHLTRSDPNLAEAVIAIDALGAVVEGLEGRLGEAEATLRDALANIRVAFVQIKSPAAPLNKAGFPAPEVPWYQSKSHVRARLDRPTAIGDGGAVEEHRCAVGSR